MAKFCGNCGAQLEDEMKVCGYCGTPSAPVNTTPPITSKQSSGKAKKILISIVAVIAVVIGIISFSSFSTESCDWCGNSPSKAYKTSSDEKFYACSDCRKECFWCGDRATKHYESYIGAIVFVCKDCYKDITE